MLMVYDQVVDSVGDVVVAYDELSEKELTVYELSEKLLLSEVISHSDGLFHSYSKGKCSKLYKKSRLDSPSLGTCKASTDGLLHSYSKGKCSKLYRSPQDLVWRCWNSFGRVSTLTKDRFGSSSSPKKWKEIKRKNFRGMTKSLPSCA
uniref:Uncharacterized protein n=1 Tax=Meloidogyne incognita TaxID=6306 RepID=A0A914KKY4_MELIC